MAKLFEQIRALRPGKSVFDLSYEKKLTCDMGELIPVQCDEVVPGDIWDVGYEAIFRCLPLAAPLLHPIYITVHSFFVPYRVLGDDDNVAFDFETFITGGSAGTDTSTVPTWNVTTNTEGSLWDYLGFPLGVDAAGARPNAWPQYAYNMIWNWYYRDQNIDTELDITSNEDIQYARWEKDYFTSARPWQQLGTSPAITGDITGSGVDTVIYGETTGSGTTGNMQIAGALASDPLVIGGSPLAGSEDLRFSATAGEVGLEVSGWDIEDFRLNVSIQRWLERNARSGYRYTEFLQSHFGVGANLDARLDRPEYLGGAKQWLVVSEVLQTSETGTTPQGTLVGHGISVGSNHLYKKRFDEFGLVMSLMCIRPKTLYHEGIDRQWLRETRYDFYFPEFAGLSEQPVLERELYCSGTQSHHETVFGYQGRYDEMRYKRSFVCGDMHADYDHWHCCRQLGGRPTLNSTFIKCDPRDDWKAATAEDGFMVSFGNRIRAIRPMPMLAEPGVGRI